jgi:hypothetical protein
MDMSRIVIVILIYHRHKPIDLIYGIWSDDVWDGWDKWHARADVNELGRGLDSSCLSVRAVAVPPSRPIRDNE